MPYVDFAVELDVLLGEVIRVTGSGKVGSFNRQSATLHALALAPGLICPLE